MTKHSYSLSAQCSKCFILAIITQRICHRLNRNHAFNFILYLKPLLRFTMSVGSQNIVWHQEFSNALLPSILRSWFPGAPCPGLRVNMESLCRLGSIFRGSLLCFILMATSHNPRFIPWSLTYVFDLSGVRLHAADTWLYWVWYWVSVSYFWRAELAL